MNEKSAQTYLPCYRVGKPMEKRVLKSVQFAEGDAVLREKLQAQVAFDNTLIRVIHSIQPPENLRQKLEARTGQSARGRRPHLLHPAILSVIFGLLLLAGFLVWTELDRRSAFPGRDNVERIVAVAQDMSGVELEPTQSPAGELGDAFYMRGFEGFILSPDLAGFRAVGTRVFKLNGHPIAQLAIDSHSALLYVFRASDFGVLTGPQWTVFTNEGWVAAIRVNDGLCAVLAFPGQTHDMEVFLKSLHP